MNRRSILKGGHAVIAAATEAIKLMQVVCSIACEEGFSFALSPQDVYFCNNRPSVTAALSPAATDPFPFPDCSAVVLPENVVTSAKIFFGVLEEEEEEEEEEQERGESSATASRNAFNSRGLRRLKFAAMQLAGRPLKSFQLKLQTHLLQARGDNSGHFLNSKKRLICDMWDRIGPDGDDVSLCEDALFLAQVADHLKVKIRQRLAEVCTPGDGDGDGLACDVSDLEAICQEVRIDIMLETNQILRKKRGGHCSMLFQIEYVALKHFSMKAEATASPGRRSLGAPTYWGESRYGAGRSDRLSRLIKFGKRRPQPAAAGQSVGLQRRRGRTSFRAEDRSEEDVLVDLVPVVRRGKRQIIRVQFKVIGELAYRKSKSHSI